MLFFIIIWLALAAVAAECALPLDLPTALITWTVLTAGLCALGAFLIFCQPMGVATLGGRIGSSIVRWGFRAGHGQLIPAH